MNKLFALVPIAAFVADLDRLRARMAEAQPSLVLIGRRHLRSNNSWQHNVTTLAKGKPRCLLQIHPADAGARGLTTGMTATIVSSVGSIVAPVEVTDTVMPGVVSLPHGWGHDLAGTRMTVAAERPGVNVNLLATNEAVDPLSGNPFLNGIPVVVSAASPQEPR